MRRRLRSLPLGVWLALGFAVAVAAPALSAGATWWAVGARQQGDADGRMRQAALLVAQTGERLADAGGRRALLRGLAALHVEADLQLSPVTTGAVGKPGVIDPSAGGAGPAPTAALEADLRAAKMAGGFVTQGLAAAMAGPDGKRQLTTRYDSHALTSGPTVGTLFVERPSGAVRLAAACAVGLLALALALIAGVVLLRRWVVAPLARLAADAHRIAGGELDVTRISSRTREVAEVGAALRGSLEAIEHGIGDGDQLRRAQDKATLLDRLVGDLFTFSRLEYAGPELTHEPLDPLAVAREAADTVDARVAVVAGSEPVALEGDHAALLRVLVNLLDNAVRHARSRVELRVCDDGDAVRFEVLDDGPGIAPDDLPQLFEPLFRADRTRNSATGGAGLGLAIVQRLTAAHGGTVQAENRPEGGARFVVRYPRHGAGRTPEAAVPPGREPEVERIRR